MNLDKVMKGGVPPKETEPTDESALEHGIECESEEHTWMSAAQIKRLVRDHLAEDSKYYVEDEDDGEDA